MSHIERRGLAYYLDGNRIEHDDVVLVRDPETNTLIAPVLVKLDAGHLRFFVRDEAGGTRETQLDYDSDLFTWPRVGKES